MYLLRSTGVKNVKVGSCAEADTMQKRGCWCSESKDYVSVFLGERGEGVWQWRLPVISLEGCDKRRTVKMSLVTISGGLGIQSVRKRLKENERCCNDDSLTNLISDGRVV